MEELQVEDWHLLVDAAMTAQVYDVLPTREETAVMRNFMHVLTYNGADMHMLLQRLGVDASKPFQLSAMPVDEGANVMYTGVFYVYGAVMMGEFDAWDIVLDMFCLSLTANCIDVPAAMAESVIEISFEAVMPWTLTESM